METGGEEFIFGSKFFERLPLPSNPTPGNHWLLQYSDWFSPFSD
jgi:hypothetical protein